MSRFVLQSKVISMNEGINTYVSNI